MYIPQDAYITIFVCLQLCALSILIISLERKRHIN